MVDGHQSKYIKTFNLEKLRQHQCTLTCFLKIYKIIMNREIEEPKTLVVPPKTMPSQNQTNREPFFGFSH